MEIKWLLFTSFHYILERNENSLEQIVETPFTLNPDNKQNLNLHYLFVLMPF